MARSAWEDATPEARAGLRNIKQHVGATPGKRTGPGSPGYIENRKLRTLSPRDKANASRERIARMDRDTAAKDRKSLATLQDARFAQEDKTFERNLETGVFGRRSSGSRRTGGPSGNADDAWKYGGESGMDKTPAYRTNASGMQLYIPGETDEKTGVTTPGSWGETIGGSGNLDAPNVPKEGEGTVFGRSGAQRYSQNIYQRKEKRADGSDRFVFTNIGSPNYANGDRNITDKNGNYDRELMHLSWREGAEDKRIAKAAAMEKAGAGKPSVATDVPIAETTAIPTNETPTIPSDSLRDAPGMAHVSGQFEDTPLYKGGVQAGKGLKNLAADFVAQYDTPKRDKVIPQLVDQGQTAPIDPRLRRKSTFLENKQFEDISTKFKDRYQLINGRWVDTQAVK